jgi:hypothetical protein
MPAISDSGTSRVSSLSGSGKQSLQAASRSHFFFNRFREPEERACPVLAACAVFGCEDGFGAVHCRPIGSGCGCRY